ncbi:MAG: hypothetical protein QOF73_253 [Thermomicrobiales bacterium]|jgi:hypothetical protein|nr:hypothetical protein [Thermomicrobiales bacterium]
MTAHDSERDDPVVYLATMPNEPLAQMWAETLRQNGIGVMVKALGPGFGAWGSSFTFEHALYVLASKLRPALLMLEDLSGPVDEDSGE